MSDQPATAPDGTEDVEDDPLDMDGEPSLDDLKAQNTIASQVDPDWQHRDAAT